MQADNPTSFVAANSLRLALRRGEGFILNLVIGDRQQFRPYKAITLMGAGGWPGIAEV